MDGTIGNRIKECRKSLGMTQQELAKKCGVNRITITFIETGRQQNILVSTLVAIAKALGKDIGFFLP